MIPDRADSKSLPTEIVAVVLLGILAIGPVLFLAIQSVAFLWFWPAVVPRRFSTRSWSYLFSPESGLLSALIASIVIAMIVTVISIAIALPAARALAQRDFAGKKVVVFLIFLPVLTPPLASAMGMHSLFLRYGIADTMIGVILVHLIPAVPYATLMLAGSLARFNPDFEAQARTLGASSFKVMRWVTLPMIAPGLTVAAVFAFLISWSQYLMTLLIGGGQVVTVPLALVAFQRGGDEAVTAALSLMFLAPAYLLFLLVTRYLRDFH